jgi:hypothetical protein
VTPLEAAKDRLRIPEVWQMLGLPGKPGNSCRSPVREDRHPSFSIFDEGRRYKDFGTGESGDALDFISLTTGLSTSAAAKEYIRLAGTGSMKTLAPRLRPRRPVLTKPSKAPAKRLDLSGYEPGTEQNLKTLSRLREINIEALRIYRDRGLLQFDCDHWLITDSSQRNAQRRRFDCGLITLKGGEKVREQSLPGSEGKWPIGAADIGGREDIGWGEGMPDFLSVLHFAYAEGKADAIAPVGMMGAHNPIHSEALPHFKGKRVLIFPDLDDAGRNAAVRWTQQLKEAGAAQVRCFSLAGLVQENGSEVNDLNDLCRQGVDCWERNYDTHEIFNF